MKEIRNQLVALGLGNVVYRLEQACELLVRVTLETLDEEIARFHNAAGVLPVIDGADYGALLLEHAGDGSQGARKALLLKHALYRARWAADGLERGTSESEYFKNISRKYKSCVY